MIILREQFERLETHFAHLSKTCEELSDVVTAQQRQIDRLTRFIEKFAEHEVEFESQRVEGNPDKPPPHW